MLYESCPDCGSRYLYFEEVDVGVGVICSPKWCRVCGWSEEFGSNPEYPTSLASVPDERDSRFELIEWP